MARAWSGGSTPGSPNFWPGTGSRPPPSGRSAFRAAHPFVRLNAMSQSVTLNLPDDLARQARALAAARNRRLEDVVIDSVARAVAEPAVEALPDEQLISLCDAT